MKIEHVTLLILLIIPTRSWGQAVIEFDSVKYNTYVYPAVREFYVTEDSVKGYSVRAGWESWIYNDKNIGITLKNIIPSSLWKEITHATNVFISGTPTKELMVMTHTHKSRLEWYLGDSLTYFISFYPNETSNGHLSHLDSLLNLTLKQPGNQYWHAHEGCSNLDFNNVDSLVIKKYPNCEKDRKPYSRNSMHSEEVAQSNNPIQIQKINKLIQSSTKVNPYKEDIYYNLYKNENYYSLELYSIGKLKQELFYYKDHLRTSKLCWHVVRMREIVKICNNR